jgi:hypothetical protein
MSGMGLKDGRTLLKTAGSMLRSQQAEIDELKAKVAGFEQDGRIMKIAQEMEEKGLNDEFALEEKVASLRERARKSPHDLDVTEEAVKLASPQGQFLGGASDMDVGGGSSLGNLNTFIMTGEDARD